MNRNGCNSKVLIPVWLCFSAESSHASQVWFLHCRVHTRSMSSLASGRCRSTTMSKPLTTLHLHSFLQLMEAPLVVSEGPRSFQFIIPPAQFIANCLGVYFPHVLNQNTLKFGTQNNLRWDLVCLLPGGGF